MKLKMIDKSILKPGDIVGIPCDTKLRQGSYFRYSKIIPKRIERITPARNYFITEDGIRYEKYNIFYELDEEAKRQTEISICAENICNDLFDIENLRRNGDLFSKSDETLISVSKMLNNVMRKLKEDNM